MTTLHDTRPVEPATTLTARHAARVSAVLATHTIGLLRISLGLVIAGFGVLKFFPGASPAEPLVMQTTEVLTFGLVEGRTAVLATAIMEVALGLALLVGRLLRPAMVLMPGWLAGIRSKGSRLSGIRHTACGACGWAGVPSPAQSASPGWRKPHEPTHQGFILVCQGTSHLNLSASATWERVWRNSSHRLVRGRRYTCSCPTPAKTRPPWTFWIDR